MTQLTGWDLLRAPIPTNSDGKVVLKPLDKSVYGFEGLTDVAEWFLWERLAQCGLKYEFRVKTEYVGSEMRQTSRKKYGTNQYETVDVRWHLAHATGELIIDGISMPAVGGSDNKKIDAALKGAVTSAFKIGCKWHGMTMGLYKGGQIRDEAVEEESTSPQSIQTAKPQEQSRQTQGNNSGASGQTTGSVPLTTAMDQVDTDKSGAAQKMLELIQNAQVKAVDPNSIPPNESEEDKKKRERMDALVWYGSVLPKPWEQGKIRALSLGFAENKRMGRLSAEEIKLETPERWLFMKLAQEHQAQCKDGKLCAQLHYNPMIAQFKFGGKIMGPEEAKQALDAVATPPPN